MDNEMLAGIGLGGFSAWRDGGLKFGGCSRTGPAGTGIVARLGDTS
jgi:hypothetical protein